MRWAPGHSGPGNVEFDGASAVVGRHHPLAMIYGGGGAFGIAYDLGVAHGLAETGIAVATAPSLGTSAGSWAASALALGVGYEDFQRIDAPSVPSVRRGVLADLARELFGERRHPLVSVSAVCVRSRRRHILSGGRYPLADLVAASSAVPGLLPPHSIDGRLYVDGGMWSATSVDAAASADRVIVVAPLGARVLGPLGRGAGLLLGRELRAWRRRYPGREIELVQPTREIAAMAGRNPLALFDGERARAVYPLALDQGREVGMRLASSSGANQLAS
ncbi:MAG: patatin-like phospholipase family protein [Acidimicrobiia bacterium]|jgi:NTE family protein